MLTVCVQCVHVLDVKRNLAPETDLSYQTSSASSPPPPPPPASNQPRREKGRDRNLWRAVSREGCPPADGRWQQGPSERQKPSAINSEGKVGGVADPQEPHRTGRHTRRSSRRRKRYLKESGSWDNDEATPKQPDRLR
ncbi:hypothetical protein ZHAS_00006293 [Anopheles sinensis]|uniref:Uncharacterized protein n=1 Tax=Anopheles sinensis TaxID=74873 RepID=A0A084VLG6_ANOSI|nr:hypothetical protein ZHAS_00006293 [Anopheles sinensis]